MALDKVPVKLIIEDDAGTLEYVCAKKRLRVGRAPGLDISRPQDNLISNRHCVITDGVLVDKASTNGTYVNGQMIEHEKETILRPGDKVAVGSTLMLVQAVPEQEVAHVDTEEAHDAPAKDMFLVYKGNKYFLPKQSIRIGRQAGNEIVLDDKLVSGSHCVVDNGELLDERSTNGTFVNGRQVPYCLEQELTVGDRLRVGEITMTIVAATEDEVARFHAQDGSSPILIPSNNGTLKSEATGDSNNATLGVSLDKERKVAFADAGDTSNQDVVTPSIASGSKPNGALKVLKAAVAVAAVVGAGILAWQLYSEKDSKDSKK